MCHPLRYTPAFSLLPCYPLRTPYQPHSSECERMPSSRLTPAALLATSLTLALSSGFAVPAHAETYHPPVVDSSLLPSGSIHVRVAQTSPCVTPVASPHLAHHMRTQQFHPLVDARPIWHLTKGEGQTVAIIDTGVNPNSRLRNLQGLGDFDSHQNGLRDCDEHGTFVAGVLAAQPADDGFAGVAPGVRILSIRQTSGHYGVLPDPPRDMPPQLRRHYQARPEGNPGNVVTLAKAVRMAADAGATVINISQAACRPLGMDLGDGPLGAALQYAVQVRDAVVVTAAGNLTQACRTQNAIHTVSSAPVPQSDVVTVVSPAHFDDLVLTVGSVAQDGRPSEFSIAGPWVDIAAPGEEIVSVSTHGLVDAVRTEDGQMNELQGTSFATPFVSGVVALVRSQHPDWNAYTVMEHVKRTARPVAGGRNTQLGYGIVDPIAAVSRTSTVVQGSGQGLPFREQPPVVHHTVFSAILGTFAAGGLLFGIIRWRRRYRSNRA